MTFLRLAFVCAALAVFVPTLSLADVIDDEPEPGRPTTPERRPEPGITPPPPAPAPPPAARPAPPPATTPMAAVEGWRFELATWLWIHAVDGCSKIDGVPIDLDLNLGDAFGHFEGYTVAGRGEAWRDRLGLFVESGWTDVDGSDVATLKPSGLDLDMDLERIYVDFGLSYAVVDQVLEGDRHFRLEPLVGGRWAQITQRASAGRGPPVRGSDREDYWEPFVGARMQVDLTDRIPLRIGGDVGGFGAGSDLTWNALAEIGYKLTKMLELRVGYAAQGIDFSTGSGSNRFVLDTDVVHGPRFGLALHF